MKNALVLVLFIFLGTELKAQPTTWEPSPGHTQIQIWPGDAPDAMDVPGPEYMEVSHELIGGKPVVSVSNVTKPTMTVYQPKTSSTGAAVVVVPGGGFVELAMDLEGTEVCDWLNAKGIACILLKYRAPSLTYDWHCKCRPD